MRLFMRSPPALSQERQRGSLRGHLCGICPAVQWTLLLQTDVSMNRIVAKTRGAQRYDLTETRASTPPSPFKACATIPERKNLYFLSLKEDSNPIPTSGMYSPKSV